MSEKKVGRKPGQKDKQPRRKRKSKFGKRVPMRLSFDPITVAIIERIQVGLKKRLPVGTVIDRLASFWEENNNESKL